MNNTDRIKELERELGRYKKAVKTRDIAIKGLKEDVAGHIQFEQILGAYIAAFIRENSGEVKVAKEVVAELIRSSPKVRIDYDGISTYTLSLENGETA